MVLYAAPQQPTLQTRLQKVYIPCLVILVLALGLQAAGFGTKGWMIMRYPSDWLGLSIFSGQMDIKVGLWEIELCIDNKCSSEDIGELHTLSKNAMSASMREYQIETSIALGFLLIAAIALALTRCCSCQRGGLQATVFVMFLLTLLSGILALTASGKFGNEQRKAHDLFNLFSASPFLFPYSLILTGIGGILAAVASLVILFGVRPWQSGPPEYPPAYEMGGAPPTASYPPAAQPAPYYAQPGGYVMPSGPQPGYVMSSGPQSGYVVSSGQPVAYNQPYGNKY